MRGLERQQRARAFLESPCPRSMRVIGVVASPPAPAACCLCHTAPESRAPVSMAMVVVVRSPSTSAPDSRWMWRAWIGPLTAPRTVTSSAEISPSITPSRPTVSRSARTEPRTVPSIRMSPSHSTLPVTLVPAAMTEECSAPAPDRSAAAAGSSRLSFTAGFCLRKNKRTYIPALLRPRCRSDGSVTSHAPDVMGNRKAVPRKSSGPAGAAAPVTLWPIFGGQWAAARVSTIA